MTLLLGDIVPDFTAETTTGPISFHDWIGDDWAFFFSHPADFTPVCTTEMGRTSQLSAEFTKRGVKPIGLSTDTVEEHLKWIEDVNDTQNTTMRFPIVADADLKTAKLYEMIHPSQSETAAVRSVFIIDSDKKLRRTMTYPMSVGRKADMEGNAEEGKGGMKRVQGGMKMDFNDVDKDGKVSRDEFLGQVDVWFTAIDRNMDGIITTADFGPRT